MTGRKYDVIKLLDYTFLHFDKILPYSAIKKCYSLSYKYLCIEKACTSIAKASPHSPWITLAVILWGGGDMYIRGGKKRNGKIFFVRFKKNGYLSPKWPKYESQVLIYTTFYFKNSP